MNRSVLFGEAPACIAIIGKHLPRHCGSATFSTDLLKTMAIKKEHQA